MNKIFGNSERRKILKQVVYIPFEIFFQIVSFKAICSDKISLTLVFI